MKLRWTIEAAENLEAIYNYLEENQAEWAKSTILRIQRELAALRRFPSIGRKTQRAGVRALTISLLPYLCIYEIRNDAIIVLHIFHTSQARPTDLQ